MDNRALANLVIAGSQVMLKAAAAGAAAPETSPMRGASLCGNRGNGGSANESPRTDQAAAAPFPKRPRAPDAAHAHEPPQQRRRASPLMKAPAQPALLPPLSADSEQGADRSTGRPNGTDPVQTESGSSGSSSSLAPVAGDPRSRSTARTATTAAAAAATATSKAPAARGASTGQHLVIVWDLSDVLSPLRSLLRAGTGAAAGGGGTEGGARALALRRLGLKWRRAVLAVGDGLLGLAQLEDLDVCHISDVRAAAAAAGTTTTAAPETSASPIKRTGSSPLPDCWPEITVQPAGKRPSAAGVRSAFEAAEAAYTSAAASGSLLMGSPDGDTAAQLPRLREETDTLCGGWLARTHATLAALGATPLDPGAAKVAGVGPRAPALPRRVSHFVVSRGQLVESMSELLALGLAPAFGAEQVYSASGATRLHCFSRINALHGPGTCFAAIGGGIEAQGAAEQLGWSYVPAAPSGIGPQNEAAREPRTLATVPAPLLPASSA